MRHYMARNCCKFTFGMLFNLLALGGTLVTPVFLGIVVQAIVEKDWETCKRISILLFIVNGVGAVFRGIQAYIFSWISITIG